MTGPLVYSYPTVVSPFDRARDMLQAVRETSSDTPEGRALWHACEGLDALLRNNRALSLPVEAIAARVAEEIGGES